MSEFNLRVVTPDGLFFDGKAESLRVRTTEGDLLILANHIDFVSILPIGKGSLKVKGEAKDICIAEGLLRVEKHQVTLITHAMEYAADIDIIRAQEAKARVENKMKEAKDQKELEYLEYKLKKALNRLSTHV